MITEGELYLDKDEAAALYLLIELAIDGLGERLEILNQVSTLSPSERPSELSDTHKLNEVINLNKELTSRAKDLIQEVGKIIVELEEPQPEILPPPPVWSKP